MLHVFKTCMIHHNLFFTTTMTKSRYFKSIIKVIISVIKSSYEKSIQSFSSHCTMTNHTWCILCWLLFYSYSFPFAISKCWILHVYDACVINHNTFPCYSDQKYLSVRNQSKVPVLTVQRFISVSFLSILCSRVWFYFFPFAQIIVGFCMCTNTHDNHNTFNTIMNRNIFIASLRTKEMQKLTSKYFLIY